MPGPEIEVKLEVRNSRRLKQRLGKLGFRRIEARHFERNVLLDFRDLRLRKARCILRLRDANHKGVLTFKAAPQRSSRYKIRGELETEVQDGRRLREILENLGMREVFRYDKYRTVYWPRAKPAKAKTPTLCCDETPIGNFVELEGPKRWIDEVARRLGYRSEDYITASYGALYLQKCLAEGKKPGNMVFPAHKT